MRRPIRPRSSPRRLLAIIIAIVTVCSLAPGAPVGARPAAAPTDIFFSEYIEGSSFNKALEIFNGTGAAVNLTSGTYVVDIYFNGATTASTSIALSGTVATGDVFVLSEDSAAQAILDQADQVSGSLSFNGDDAIVLRKGAGSTIVDVIGDVGFDPGTAWSGGGVSTLDRTLRRKAAIEAGDTNPSNDFDPSVEWDGFANDTFGGLGSHGAPVGDTAPAVSTVSPTNNQTNVPLDAGLIITFNEAVTLSGSWFQLVCATSGTRGPADVAVTGGALSFNLDPTANFASGEICTLTVFASGVSDQDATDPPNNPVADFVSQFTTLAANACEQATTTIPVIQGSGASSPAENQTRTVKGVVVGDFQGTTGLNGFFLQDPDGDGNTATSDGIFVFVPTANPLASIDVEVGDLVKVSGTVKEFNTLTELDTVTEIVACGSDTVAATVVTLPETVNGDLERYEGMLVTIPQTLTAAQNFFQGRFGQVTLAADGRAFGPTNSLTPGSAAAQQAADLVARRLLVLDDGSSAQNPNPIPYIGADNTLRAGDTVSSLTGTLDFGPISSDSAIRDYRLHPTVAPSFSRANPRPSAPESVGGNLKISSFNVLNYFNGDGQGGGFPTSRGANTLAEFNRQRVKEFAAITTIDAGVLGLMEMENDGSGANSAIQDLVNGLNAATSPGRYAFVAEPSPGTDEIKVSLLYQPGRVTPLGAAQNYQFTDPTYGELFERQPLAQTFRLNSNNAVFTVSVNHFKSKSSCPASGPDLDQGDGQGCWNAKRVRQAEQLLVFIDQLQDATGDSDVLVMGDLNAYGKEDPITTLTDAGLVNKIAEHVSGPYSFIFDGQSGYLDHALVTASLDNQVNDVTEWHINADEPSVIDYNTEFKPQDLYAATPYRSSDHDPVIIGLNLGAATPGSPGGKGFGIAPQADSIELDWTAGSDQLAYLLARDPTAVEVLPPSATAHTDTDPAPKPNLNCYVLFPLGPTGPLGQSDFLCAQLGLRSSSGVPGDFKLRLNESATASLSWTAPGGQNAYALLAVPLNGSSARILPLGPNATSATDSTGGTFTCYMLLASLANGVSNTDLTCGLPGTAQFSATATRTSAATETARTKQGADMKQAQATAERLFKRQAEQVLQGSTQKLEQKLRDGIKDAEQQLKRQSDKPPVPKPARRDEPAATPKPSPTPTGTSGPTSR